MTVLEIERTFAAPIEQVFDFVTRPEHLVKWWGPEGTNVSDGTLDLTSTGAWDSTMKSQQGNKYKVSGQVTKVKRPNLVAFTWGWHDENDARGHESHVMIELQADGDDRTRFKLKHQKLADEESVENHNIGWTSSIRKLERCFE